MKYEYIWLYSPSIPDRLPTNDDNRIMTEFTKILTDLGNREWRLVDRIGSYAILEREIEEEDGIPERR